MATLESIQARIAKLQVQAQELVAKQSIVVLDKIRELMTKHGITTADIEAHVGKRRGRKPETRTTPPKQAVRAPKYRDPATGATWTGHGRAPAWIAAARDRNKFLISGVPADATVNTKNAAKAGNYVRGPQPAMYQDPKTGTTWSGRGRAPAWIAGARDRTKFLIEKAVAPSTRGKTKPDKTGPAGKTATRKTAKKKASARKLATKKAAPQARKAASKKGRAAKSPVARKVRAASTASTSAKHAKAAHFQPSAETTTAVAT
ncbi:DNA-binding protein H-NS [Paraburkholderia kururiensis]|uniref:H-NS family nucleoid-associated regulatory protein n=1 Tax=Paraburkholderia kururiensis TaxID=984307 RepID=UPI0039A724F7